MRDVMEVLCDALIEAGRDDAAEVVRLVVERDDLARWLRTEAAYSTPGRDHYETYGCPECETYDSESHNRDCVRADYLRAMVPGWAEIEIARAQEWASGEDAGHEARRRYARLEAEREAREPLLRQAREASDRIQRELEAALYRDPASVVAMANPPGLGSLERWIDERRRLYAEPPVIPSKDKP